MAVQRDQILLQFGHCKTVQSLWHDSSKALLASMTGSFSGGLGKLQARSADMAVSSAAECAWKADRER